MTPFPREKSLIGMIHVAALPGSPRSKASPGAIVAQAAREATLLLESGFDALLIENMHDCPYVQGPHQPHIVSVMTAVAIAVREVAPSLPLGVQVLATGNAEALAVALAASASPTRKPSPLTFIRCENFVFSHVADEGLLPTAEAGPLLRYRKSIDAEHIAIFTDIKKKHASHAITADLSISDTAKAAQFFGSDGLIVTGPATAMPVNRSDLAEVRESSSLPVLVGSGVTPESVGELFELADALIVGSSIKKDGVWSNPLDPKRCRKLVRAANAVR